VFYCLFFFFSNAVRDCQAAIKEAVDQALAEQSSQAQARNPKKRGIRGILSRLSGRNS
jgi:hypothetical protein